MKDYILEAEKKRYIERTPKSQALQIEAEKFLPGGSSRTTAYFDPYPHFIEKGIGKYIYDVDDNEYLDLMINATSLILGHSHPDIVSSVQEQSELGLAFSGPTESQISLAKILCDRIPSVDTIRFTNSGTEGTMMAIRAAREFTGRRKIVKVEGGYHGAHEYVAVSVYASGKDDAGDPKATPEYSKQPKTITDDVIVIKYNDIDSMDKVLSQNAKDIACVIIEPVVSNFGYLPADGEFLAHLRRLTDETGIILIFDEVQSFRLAQGGAQELLGVIPDMTCLGKIIGGGLPIGAFGGREDIMRLFDPTQEVTPISHAGTFNANPVTMRAGEVVMNHLTQDVYYRINAMGEVLRNKLSVTFDELEIPIRVTGIGSLFGLHFTASNISNYDDVLASDLDKKTMFFLGMLNEGVLMQTGIAGSLNVLSTEDDIDRIVNAARKVAQRTK